MPNCNNGLYERDFECILVDKVFDSCLKKACFEDVRIRLPKDIDNSFYDLEVRFKNGFIKPNTLKVLSSPILPEDCKRIKMTVVVDYIVIIKTGGKCFEMPAKSLEKELDIVMYHPDTRPEFKFDIILETRGEVLDQIIEDDNDCDGKKSTLVLAIGLFIITKVIGKVQLKLDQVFPYCVPPRECKNFMDVSACDDFEFIDFPEDFYPEQSQYIYPCKE